MSIAQDLFPKVDFVEKDEITGARRVFQKGKALERPHQYLKLINFLLGQPLFVNCPAMGPMQPPHPKMRAQGVFT